MADMLHSRQVSVLLVRCKTSLFTRQHCLAILKYGVCIRWMEGDCCFEYVPKPCLNICF
jgi:hypothetical protein